jgi:SsrA-binding protein
MKKPKQPAQPEVRDPNAKHLAIQNRKARHDYTIVETYDAGLALMGTEVKSIRGRQANLVDAFAKVEGREVWLYNMHVTPYDHGTRWNAEPRRKRKLLLHRSEITRLAASVDRKGYALIPLSIYFQRGYAKVELGVGLGKREYDKRDSIAQRDADRERDRELAQRE